MDSRDADERSMADLFEQFVEATTMRNVLAAHQKLLDNADLRPCEFNIFFPRFKRAVTSGRQKKNWKAKALFSKIDKRAAQKCYSNTKAPTSSSDKPCDTSGINSTSSKNPDVNPADDENAASSLTDERNSNNNHALKHYNCLVIGSGPAGLRTAIELQLLGASRVVIVEKRGRFSRNNVLHLWPFVIDDLKSLGAKKFYGKFCAGSIDHISIRQLQLMLLKVCLMIGCDFRDSCSYVDLCPASLQQESKTTTDGVGAQSRCELERAVAPDRLENQENDETKAASLSAPMNEDRAESGSGKRTGPKELNLNGVRAHFQCNRKPQEEELHSIEWDIVLGADGRRNTLSGFFPRLEFRGRLAIAITANFINRQTPAETSVPEISGLSFIYNQEMFNTLAYDTNIQLENICYYKDDTHYFVMTAKKRSLLERGVLLNDYAATKDLLSDDNVDKAALLRYAKDAAYWTTGLEPLDFALNHYGQEDCAMFDFTSMYAASNACRALRTTGGGLALFGLVGDSLLEPFWPTGSGCARGFLSSFDAAWMCRQWAVNKCAVIENRGLSSSRFGRSRGNTSSSDINKPVAAVEPTTYDRMAMNVIAERESIYRILAQTTSENLHQNYSHWTLNPHTRYPNLNRHLVSPGQVEHLVAKSGNEPIDSKLLSPKSAGQSASRRVKSPTNSAKSRRSPKKLKSAGASPLAQPRNAKNQYKSKQAYKSKSRNDITIDDYYLEFEQSYKDLDDTGRGGANQYLNYKQRNSIDLDDLFIPSLSGTLPSSNNLSKLEARKARDIDECLRQRRQKSKIHIVRDQLISQMRSDKNPNGTPIISGGNAVLFSEIKRLRVQQSRGDSKPRDVSNGPLSLLNSMRRCASFAERVKSFENKLTNPQPVTPESTPVTPKTPIDNVKNLPQFATLQELIINNAQNSADQGVKKSRIPVSKFSKEDWNVQCWEKRLSAHKQQGLSASCRSLSKAVSVDSGQDQQQLARFARPQKQVDIFQDRIKEMEGKLESGKPVYGRLQQAPKAPSSAIERPLPQNRDASSRSGGGWINHLKRELSKGSGNTRRAGPPMNPTLPNKPIKKLFEDEEEDDDGIDVNKHYDHLCVNRPTNKYLAKGAYTGHLARTKYNSATSKVINRPQPTAESKQAYLAALTSRGSSASSTMSDYSTNTGGNSSSGSAGAANTAANLSARASVIDVECFRCRKFVSSADRITIGTSSIHRSCLACGQCGLTLRMDELQHYLDQAAQQAGDVAVFLCAICKPDIRVDLSREASSRLIGDEQEAASSSDRLEVQRKQSLQSREAFLSTKINYGELYKNILHEQASDRGRLAQSQREPSPKVTPSPVQVTLPLSEQSSRSRTETPVSECGDQGDDVHELSDAESSGRRTSEFSISERQTVDGNEHITVILAPPADGKRDDTPETSRALSAASTSSQIGAAGGRVSSTTTTTTTMAASERRVSKESEMIDEEELERILHLDNRLRSRKSSEASSSSSSASSSSSLDEDDENSNGRDGKGESDDSVAASRAASESRRQREGSTGSGVSNSDHRSSSADDSSAPSAAATDDNSSSLDIPSDSE